jgi:aconitate hydratase
MGVIPIVLPGGLAPAELALEPEDRIIVALPRNPARRGDISIMIARATKPDLDVTGRLACETTREIDILKAGGILSETLNRLIG